MTDREKYLIILDRFYRGRGGSLLTKDESEALDYAISSIKTDLKYDLLYEETTHIADADKKIESTTKNDLAVDLISRADVLKLIYDYKDNHFENRKEYPINYGTLLDMIRWVRALPSVTPQLRKGHWISTETKGVRYAFWCRYKCSLCGELSDYKNFCPNCGAKMESEDKE